MGKYRSPTPEDIDLFLSKLTPQILKWFTRVRAEKWVHQGYCHPIATFPKIGEKALWCDQQFGLHQYKIYGQVIGFKSAENAVMFKLRWG